MTTTTLHPTDPLSVLGLKDGDAMTASLEGGRLVVSVHTKDDIVQLEKSLDTSRDERPIPLEDDLFARLRNFAKQSKTK